MATKLIDRIAFDYGKFKFNMLVDNPITIIGGDSSSGKTLFCDSLSSYSRIKWPNTFSFLNYRSEEVSFTLRKFRNKVVVIDNADVILSDEDIKYIIRERRNQYIIISEFSWKFSVDPKAISVMYEPKKACFVLLYLSRSRWEYEEKLSEKFNIVIFGNVHLLSYVNSNGLDIRKVRKCSILKSGENHYVFYMPKKEAAKSEQLLPSDIDIALILNVDDGEITIESTDKTKELLSL